MEERHDKAAQTITWENYLIVKHLCVLGVSSSNEVRVIGILAISSGSGCRRWCNADKGQVRVSAAALAALWTFVIIFPSLLFIYLFLPPRFHRSTIFQFHLRATYRSHGATASNNNHVPAERENKLRLNLNSSGLSVHQAPPPLVWKCFCFARPRSIDSFAGIKYYLKAKVD